MTQGTVLLVDDSDDDRMLMNHATQAAGVNNPIVQLSDGQQAIDYLSGDGDYANCHRYPLPCLVITDLKMPQKDGFDLLEWMAQRPEFDSVPRIVVTSSALQKDWERARNLGACACFQKPLQLEGLVDLVRHLNDGWIARHCPKAHSTTR